MRGELAKRLLSLEAILRRSLVIDDSNAYGHPQVNAEVSTALQLRGVLKLLLAKVPRKENKVQDNEHYILLAGKCLAVEAGVEALVDQSLTRLFSSVQKKQVPGYRVIRPLVDPILLSNEAGKPLEDIVVMSEETAVFARVGSDLKYQTALRALALKKKKVRLRQDKLFAKDTDEGGSGEHSSSGPRFEDEDCEYLIEHMSPGTSQPLSVFLSAQRSPKQQQEHDPDLEIIGTGSESEDEGVPTSSTSTQQPIIKTESRVRNVIRHYKRMKNRLAIASNEVDRSMINDGRKAMLQSVVETFREEDREFGNRDVEDLFPDREDDEKFTREFLEYANSHVMPREELYLQPAQATHLKLREFWRKYLAQTNPGAGDMLTSKSEPLLRLDDKKDRHSHSAHHAPSGETGAAASSVGLATPMAGTGAASASSTFHNADRRGGGSGSPHRAHHQLLTIRTDGGSGVGGGGLGSGTFGAQQHTTIISAHCHAKFTHTRWDAVSSRKLHAVGRWNEFEHNDARGNARGKQKLEGDSHTISPGWRGSDERNHAGAPGGETKRRRWESSGRHDFWWSCTKTDLYRMRNGQISIEKFLEAAHDKFQNLEDARKAMLTGMFQIKYADKGVELLRQGQDWEQILAVIGGTVDVFLEFDQKQSDQRPFNNYIKEQSLLVQKVSSNVFVSAGSGVWFGQVVEPKDGAPGGGRVLTATQIAMQTQEAKAKPKPPPICPVTVITREETVYITCPREPFGAFLRGEGFDKVFHLDRLSWIPSTSLIKENHTSDMQWTRFKHDSFRDILSEGIDVRAKSFYQSAKPTLLQWFKTDGPSGAYKHVPATNMRVQRAKSAGVNVKNLSEHVTQSMIPYTSRFLNNRVPPGGGPLMRTSWSG
eukprot:g19382.t1